MPKADYLRLKKYALKVNDLLISVVGTLGNVSIITEDNLPAIFSCKSTVLRCSSINPFFLLAYLNTPLIRALLLRKTRGAVQLGLNLDDLKTIIVVDFSNNFQVCIENIYKKSLEYLANSKSLYTAAQDLLLSELGLKDFKPTNTAVSVKTFANSFGVSGRLDAEYYQPKYDEVEDIISKFETVSIKDIINYPVSSGVTPKAGGDDYTDSENGIPFIRAVDIIANEVVVDNCNYIKPNIHNGILKRTQLKRNDVLFSIAGTVGRCGIFNYSIEANINQAVSILRFDEAKVKRLYLICYFNSFVGELYISKYSRQGLQTNLNLQEVSDLRLPLLDMGTQQKISDKVQHSFDLRKKSITLLEYAKQAVEMAIEQGEDAAIRWLEEKVND